MAQQPWRVAGASSAKGGGEILIKFGVIRLSDKPI